MFLGMVLLSSLSAFPLFASAAVTYDGSTYHASPSPTTAHIFDHTVSGADAIVLVSVVTYNSGTPVVTATYGGVSLTQLGATQYSSTNQANVTTFYLAGVATGTQSVEVDTGANYLTYVIVGSYAGVSPSNPIASYEQNIDNSNTQLDHSQTLSGSVGGGWSLKFTRSANGRIHNAGAGTLRKGNGNTDQTGSLIDTGAGVSASASSTLTASAYANYDRFLGTMIKLNPAISLNTTAYHGAPSPTTSHKFNLLTDEDDPFLVVNVVSYTSDPGSTTVKYGGTSLVQLGDTQYSSTNQTRVSTYYLAAPPTGNLELEVTTTNAVYSYVLAGVYAHVAQTSPVEQHAQVIDDSNTNASNGQTLSVSTPGAWTVKFTRSANGRVHKSLGGVLRWGNGDIDGTGSMIDRGYSLVSSGSSSLIAAPSSAYDRYLGTMLAFKPRV